jgi:hypothetical protein
MTHGDRVPELHPSRPEVTTRRTRKRFSASRRTEKRPTRHSVGNGLVAGRTIPAGGSSWLSGLTDHGGLSRGAHAPLPHAGTADGRALT